MARDHYIAPTVPEEEAVAVRLGAGTGSANNLSTTEIGKFVKLVAESRFDLAAVGDEVEGAIYAVELAP